MGTSVTVVSCLYGDYGRFVPRWGAAIERLERQPDAVTVETRQYWGGVWAHPQAELLDRAIRLAKTEWVWIVDIDDEALPTGLNGIDELDADVWQMGYADADGRVAHIPPRVTNDAYFGLTSHNYYAAGSAFRRLAYLRAGGFPDVAFQDWALWRRLAAIGCTFRASDRAHYVYHRHDATRSARELTAERRSVHLREMLRAD